MIKANERDGLMFSSQPYMNTLPVVRIEALDERKRTVSYASGFLIEEDDYLSLYTCWHVVSGVDPDRLPIEMPPRRKHLRIFSQGITRRTTGIGFGGENSFDMDLFSAVDDPVWKQGKPREGSENADVPVPILDCVRLNVEHYRSKFAAAFEQSNINKEGLRFPSDGFIVGYPYGYNPVTTGLLPIFLKRSPAIVFGDLNNQLLDGAGAKGMSGSPVLTFTNNIWSVVGIYTGAIFPEATYFKDDLIKNNNQSMLPLGKFSGVLQFRSELSGRPMLDD